MHRFIIYDVCIFSILFHFITMKLFISLYMRFLMCFFLSLSYNQYNVIIYTRYPKYSVTNVYFENQIFLEKHCSEKSYFISKEKYYGIYYFSLSGRFQDHYFKVTSVFFFFSFNSNLHFFITAIYPT